MLFRSFSEDDVREMFNYYSEAGWIKGDVEAMIEEMKPWYDTIALLRKDCLKVVCSTATWYSTT